MPNRLFGTFPTHVIVHIDSGSWPDSPDSPDRGGIRNEKINEEKGGSNCAYLPLSNVPDNRLVKSLPKP